MRRSYGLSAAAVAAALLSFAFPDNAQGAGLVERSCRLAFASLPAAFAQCAALAVPVDPSRPDGPTIELFVARIAALSSAPKPDPLLIITGGPGQSTVDFYLQLRGAFEQVRRERDLILVDQRGTGRSAAGFSCDVPDDLALETAGEAELVRFVDECLAALEHDPSFYTTSVAVQDLERLRTALELPEWNVYGVSYGTRVAQHYARRFPAATRAIILDGVVPAEVALGPEVAVYAQRALERIFERCEQDPQCGARFTNLPERFREVIVRLEAAPVPMPPSYEDAASSATFGAAHAKALARFMSYNGQTAALLPMLITEAYEGNYAPLAGQTNTILRGLPEALSFPMSNAVICTEDVPFMQPSGVDLSDTYLGTAIVDALTRICARWPAGAIDADFKIPLATDRPTLLLSGDSDPITPPEYADRAIAGGVANSVHLVAPGQGHGLAAVGCVPRIMRAFLEAPTPDTLDADCLAIEPAVPFFLSPKGPAP